MEKGEARVTWESLWAFTKEVFVRVGLPPEDAETVAAVLIWANLRGVDSHGVQRILGYVERVNMGQMNPRPNIRVLQETPATVFIEGDHAFGPVVTTFAMDQVMKKAQEVGIGWGIIRNTTHQGAIGYYALMAAQKDMAGITWVCSLPNMAPYGARAAGVDNSPIAIAVPGKRHRPLVLDMATSIVAAGKLQVAVDKGIAIPEDWALDKEGNPTTDPQRATILLPAAGYKGYGLAFMLECLTSLMVGNPLALPTLLSQKPAPAAGSHATQNSVVAAIDIGSFTDVERYKEDVDEFVGVLRALPKAEGVNEIFVPGEIEDRVHDERVQHGIPLPPGTVRKLQDVAQRFGIELPPGV
jgi:LDH2 family malate/lactate/ureidoglycolate dehydrogenase